MIGVLRKRDLDGLQRGGILVRRDVDRLHRQNAGRRMDHAARVDEQVQDLRAAFTVW
jgi:hypothetical protein